MVAEHAEIFSQCVQALKGDRPQAGLQEVCDLLYEHIPTYSWVGVYVVRGNELHLAAWAGDQPTEHTVINKNQGLCGWAASTGELVNVPDVSQDRRYLECFANTRSELVVPVLRTGEPIGEIDIDSTVEAAFGTQDEVFCNRLAVEMAEVVAKLQQGAWEPVGH